MKIGYKGFEKSGKPVKGVIEADDLQQARERVRRQGVFVSEVFAAQATGVEVDDTGREKTGPIWSKTQRMERVSALARQLALLVRTGTPVVDALGSLERQTPQGDWRKVITSVREKLETGRPLAEALQPHPEYFDAVCRSLVAAGESGGRLEVMLDRLSRLMRQEVKVRKQLTGAMIYPALLICVALGVITTMVTFVLPRFKGLFTTLNTSLPPLTKALMAASDFMRAWWWAVLVGVVALISGLVMWVRSDGGKLAIDRLVLVLPVVGPVARAFSTARIARLMSVLLDGRVPVLDALSLTRYSVRNSRYINLLATAEEMVLRGENLSVALGDTDLLSPTIIEAVRSGEKSGQLATIMASVAEHMDEDNETAIKTLTGLIEPVILIVMGLIVGAVAVGMMLPLFDLTAGAGGG